MFVSCLVFVGVHIADFANDTTYDDSTTPSTDTPPSPTSPTEDATPTQHQCPTDRFLLYGNMPKSRHSNRLISFIAALEYARMLNRTVVVPNGGDEDAFESVYNLDNVRKTHCWIHRSEYKGAATKGCIRMKGAASSNEHCVDGSASAASKLKFSDVDTAARSLSHIAQLYFPLTIYLGDMVDVWRVWAGISPAPKIAQFVASYIKTTFAGKPFTGVHLRSLERSCGDRAKQITSSKATQRELSEQCAMRPEYVAKYTGGGDFFLAHDGQQPAAAAALQAIGGKGVPPRIDGVQLEKSEFMLVDFWVLVAAEKFVGIQMSTLSNNVCMARKGRAKSCNNFVEVRK